MKRGLRVSALIVALALSTLSLSTSAQQAANQNTTREEQRLIELIKQEIMKEFLNGDLLQQQIELGIKEYIKKEQDAQVAARAEQARAANEKSRSVRPVSRERDHIYGSPDAAISLIEYSDFECPYCKSFHSIPKEIVKAYDGRVNWVYRHFPLSFHNPGAQKEAQASECANELGGNDAFWTLSNAIYARTQSNGQGFPLTRLVPLATEIGLDGETFQRCLESGKDAARVQEDLAEGINVGVTGTPATILVNNKTGATSIRTGAVTLAAFKADIDTMLK